MLKFEKLENMMMLTNCSEVICVVSRRPKPPRRKIVDIWILAPKTFVIFENNEDIEELMFSFKK